MVAVVYPWFIAVQEGGEYDGSIEADLSALLQMFVVPYSFVESAESALYLGQSVVYFPVDLGIWCEGTPYINGLMNCLLLSSTDGDVGRVVFFLGCRLVEDPSLLQAYQESEELSSLCKVGKLGAAGLFWCGPQGQRCQRKGGHRTTAQVFLWGHVVFWG